jgi:hypothetical protein
VESLSYQAQDGGAVCEVPDGYVGSARVGRAHYPRVRCGARVAGEVGSAVDGPPRSPPERLEELLQQVLQTSADSVNDTVPHAIRLLTIAYWLPQLAAHLSIHDWWRVATHLLAVCRECQLGEKMAGQPEPFVVATLLGGELPLALSCLLGELKPLRELRAPARISLSESLCEATDGEGIVAARLLPYLPMLFSSWTRCRALGRAIPKGCWTTEAETQYEWLVRQTILFSRASGTPLLTDHSYRNWPGGPMDAALSLAGDRSDRVAATARLGKLLLSPRGLRDAPLPDASVESEWATLAVLAGGWDTSTHRFAINYSEAAPRVELEVAGKMILAGDWNMAVTAAGKPLDVASEWEQQCWFSNDECDYLEIAADLTQGGRIERQILFGKEDEFLLLNDVLHTESQEGAEWTHSHQLPLASGINFLPEAETRDGVLVNAKGRPVVSVMPPALPEWRVDPRGGELSQQLTALRLTHRSVGTRGSAPIWFDLRTKRVNKPRTWRQLTVAASLAVVARDVAVGYRVQSAGSQWVVYRSLAPPANRTVLGQNTAAETLVGRFLKSGELDVLVEVDPA